MTDRAEDVATTRAPLITYRCDREVASIQMDRPARLNAASPELVAELRSCVTRADEESATVIILSGSGRAFSAGHDLKAPPLHPRSIEEASHLQSLQEITRILRGPGVISIAAVHGYALGAGLEFALSCDFVVADPDTMFGFPEVSVGLSVTGGISYLLPNAVGLPQAKKMILLGELFNARHAHHLGLVSHLAKPGEHLETAYAVADRLASLPRKALSIAKEGLERGVRQGMEDAMAYEIRSGEITGESDESTRARERFSHKREA